MAHRPLVQARFNRAFFALNGSRHAVNVLRCQHFLFEPEPRSSDDRYFWWRTQLHRARHWVTRASGIVDFGYVLAGFEHPACRIVKRSETLEAGEESGFSLLRARVLVVSRLSEAKEDEGTCPTEGRPD